MLAKRKVPLGVEKMGEPIQSQQLRNTVQTGITYRRPSAGLVPEVEERGSARFNGYTRKEWSGLPYEDRVDGIAYYRLRKLIEMHEEETVSREINRRSRSPNHR